MGRRVEAYSSRSAFGRLPISSLFCKLSQGRDSDEKEFRQTFQMNIPPKNEAAMNVLQSKSGLAELIQTNQSYFAALCRVSEVNIVDEFSNEVSAKFIERELEFQLPLAGMIDIDAEKSRLESEIQKKENILKGTLAKLSNEKFVNGAPAHIVDHERAKKDEIEAEIEKLKANIASLG